MAKKEMKWYDWTAIVLIITGALNWGLVGFFDFNLVVWLANLIGWSWLKTIIYDLVGIAGVYSIISLAKR